MTLRIAEIVVDVQSRQVDKGFDYLIPEQWHSIIQPGARVLVPFGRQKVSGFVLALKESADVTRPLKSIAKVLDVTPLLTPELLKLANWLKGRYVCTTLQSLQSMIPSAFRVNHKGQSSKMLGEDKVAAKVSTVVVASVPLDELAEQAFLRSRKAKGQARVLQQLCDSGGEFVLSELAIPPSNPSLQALVEEKLVHLVKREVYRETSMHRSMVDDHTSPKTHTTWQTKALTQLKVALSEQKQETFVLHGVTGSGKTEVYLEAIAEVLQGHGSAIVLVPEISLTPQMVGRFTGRFGDDVAVLHSGLSVGERRDEWLKLRRGEAKIAVGARSAVFAPVQNLRLIIIDEEHEASYKQDESPRYDAREVAEWRTRESQAVIVLGSATPSLQTVHRAESGGARMLTMPIRVNGRPLPPIEVVDMREELRGGNRSLFSTALTTALEETIGLGQQAILFLNRRGFAAFVMCRACGETIECPRCDIALTLHKHSTSTYLSCHYCDYQQEMRSSCPKCQAEALRPFGVGTQQVEQFIKHTWPAWKTVRMDVDTTRKKGSHQKILNEFASGEAEVLIGTQMIAKGLDFPNVSLVGVIAADTMLSVPDFRSAERTFQLLTQVAGRAGRAEIPGRTVVQTYRPTHYSITAAANHDTTTFYQEEKTIRSMFDYPPYCELTVFVASHTEAHLAEGAASRFERELRRRLAADIAVILPATPTGVRRIEDKFRYQVVVKYVHWDDVCDAVTSSFQLVYEKMHSLHGICTLDVSAGRIG